MLKVKFKPIQIAYEFRPNAKLHECHELMWMLIKSSFLVIPNLKRPMNRSLKNENKVNVFLFNWECWKHMIIDVQMSITFIVFWKTNTVELKCLQVNILKISSFVFKKKKKRKGLKHLRVSNRDGFILLEANNISFSLVYVDVFFLIVAIYTVQWFHIYKL